jgi:hypothetical protein
MRCQALVQAIERGAVRADDLGCIAHIEEDVGMVERRPFADAHELPRPDLDDRHAGRVVEMRYVAIRHDAIRFLIPDEVGVSARAACRAPYRAGLRIHRVNRQNA